MIFTARQLEEMQRRDGKIVLPYRARLTPLAQDWIRQRKLEVGYADTSANSSEKSASGAKTQAKWLWWCDSPCGPAKAALFSVAHEAGVDLTEIAVDPLRVVETIKIVAKSVKSSSANGAVLLVNNAATAMVFANRCPGLRAVLATSLEAVELASRQLAANVLVVEHPQKSLTQIRALLARFAKAKRTPDVELSKQLAELATCA